MELCILLGYKFLRNALGKACFELLYRPVNKVALYVLFHLFFHTDSQLQYIRKKRLKRFSSDPSSTLSGSPRETTRTLSTGSTASGDGEHECPPTLLTKEGDLSTATDGNTKPPADRRFEVGDLVKVEPKGSPWYEVIHWIGQLPGSSKRIAGIEMVCQFSPVMYIVNVDLVGC